MSYELDCQRYAKCPCGNGRIVEKSYSNDWGQSDEMYTIECADCNKLFHIEKVLHIACDGEFYYVPYIVSDNDGSRSKVTFNNTED